MIRTLRIWWGCKKLNRLVRQAKQKREQALKGRDQRGRFVRRTI